MLKAFVIMPFREPFEAIYSEILEPVLGDLGCTPTRADRIPSSSFIVQDIYASIEAADLVIVETSEVNANVYLELGYAIALKKELLLLARVADQVPFDIRHLRHLTYDVNDRSRLREAFANWVKATSAYRRHEKRIEGRVLTRGEIFDAIFDSTGFIQAADDTHEEMLFAEMQARSIIPCKFAYSMERGSRSWLRLCNDPLYTVFHESISFLSAKATDLLRVCGERYLSASPDVVSLGPGNGHKDRIILRALCTELSARGADDQLFYYPVDISLPILSTAIRTVSQDRNLTPRLRIKAIHTDFSHLGEFKPVLNYRSEPNLFLFLGNTLGNMQDEVNFLLRVQAAMCPGDVLVLEVRLQTGQLLLGGQMSDQLGLACSPLGIFGVTVDQDRIEFSERDGVSQVRNTRTVVTQLGEVTIRGTRFDQVLLSCVNYYDVDSLQATLEGSTLGFHVLERFTTRQLGIFIIQKS